MNLSIRDMPRQPKGFPLRGARRVCIAELARVSVTEGGYGCGFFKLYKELPQRQQPPIYPGDLFGIHLHGAGDRSDPDETAA